ncbi:MAG: ABC transporter permease [Candidatus Zapsychrus exili]|nr:ABC transporter permease [Candidatus Zapsychrus exili]
MNYESWISYRYLTANKGRFLSFLNFISIAGVAIGVASLIVVTAVMTGFGNNLREKIIGTTPHIMIEKETGVKNYEEIIDKINNLDSIEGTAAYIQGNIFLENKGHSVAIAVRGVNAEDERKVTKVDQYLVEGNIKELIDDNIIIGSELARYFGYKIGDKVTLISPGSGMAGRGWRYSLNISGIFNTGMADYDMSLVVVDLKKAQEIFNFADNTVTGVGVRLKDVNNTKEVKNQIYEILGFGFIVRTWIDINRNLFEALFLEKWGLFIILTLMVLIASFNIISTLIVTVTSKVQDIGILKSIGVPNKSIRNIFIRQGVFIGSLGTLLGLVGGVGLSYILGTYVKVPKEIYSIDRVPVELQFFDILITITAAMVISYLATIYPASRASNLEPVEALRYE